MASVKGCCTHYWLDQLEADKRGFGALKVKLTEEEIVYLEGPYVAKPVWVTLLRLYSF